MAELSSGTAALGGRGASVQDGVLQCGLGRDGWARRVGRARGRQPGEGGYVSAEPVRRHVAALAAEGVGLKTVARLAGVSSGGLARVVYGDPGRGRPPSRRVRAETARRVLAVRAADAAGGQRVASGPTWALVEELLAAGYTRAQLAQALGSRARRPKLQLGRRTVRASTARAVEDLHRRLLGTQR